MQTVSKPAVKVGLVAIVVIVVFIYFTYKLEGKFWGKDYRDISIRFEFVGQLEPGNAVRLAGVQIGYVQSIGFMDMRLKDPVTGQDLRDPATGEPRRGTFVMVTARILSDMLQNLHKDSRAKIGQSGIIGDFYIELTYGSGPSLEPGDIIEGTGPFSLDDLAQEAVVVSQSLQQVMNNLNDFLGEEQTKESFSLAVRNVAEFTERLNQLTDDEEGSFIEFFRNMREFSERINQIADQVDATLAGVNQVVDENRQNINLTIENAAQISTELRQEVVADIRRTSTHLREIGEKLDQFIEQNRHSASNLIEEYRQAGTGLREATEKVNRILDRMESDGGMAELLLGSATVAEDLTDTISKAHHLVDRTKSITDSTRFVYEFRYYENDALCESDNRWRNDAGVMLDLTDRVNFYLGASDIGRDTGLDLFLGYRYQFLNFRAGVRESEAALGLDLQPFSRLVLTAEGVGLTHEDKERLDLRARFQLYRGLHSTLGVQDVGDDALFHGGLRLEF